MRHVSGGSTLGQVECIKKIQYRNRKNYNYYNYGKLVHVDCCFVRER